MHSEIVAGFVSAWMVTYVAIAAYCATVWRRFQADRETTQLGLLSLVLAVHDFATAAGSVALGWVTLSTWVVLASAAHVLATALVLHFALVHVDVPRPRALLGATYCGAALCMSAVVAGWTHRIVPSSTAVLGAVADVSEEVAARPLGAVPVAALQLVAVGIATYHIGRAFFRGALGVFGSLFGVVILLLAQLHDGLWALDLGRGLLFAPFGHAAFTLGVIVTLLQRYTAVRRELEKQARVLRQRTKELSKANDDLQTAQSRLVKKEQLAAVGELSAVVAHEVRNPLSIISNAVSSLRRSGHTMGEEDRATLLGILDDETSRLNRLVGDLLHYARPVTVARQLTNLRDLLTQSLRLVAGRADVTVEMLEPAPVPKVWVDPVLVRQIVDNLITNSLEAMSAGGTLTITLRPSGAGRDLGAEIVIHDTGEGMDTTVRNRAFDAFFTTRQSGTGLGLAIVARIIDAHGGRLTMQSAAGAGTSVLVYLPVGSAQAVTRSDPAPRATPVPPMPAFLAEELGVESSK